MTGPRLRLRAGDLDWQRIEGETIALDVSGAQYIAVNESGSLLWAALAEGATRDELVAALVEGFAISEQQATADVDAFIAALHEQDLLAEL